jgi:hypothetical protein
MRPRHLTSTRLALPLLIVAGIVGTCTPAQANVRNPFIETITPQPTIYGGRSFFLEQSTGDIYIVAVSQNTFRVPNTHAVYRIDSSGRPVNFSALGTDALEGANTPQGEFSFVGHEFEVAVDESAGPAKGDIYVTDPGHGVVDVFDQTGAYIGQLTGTSTETYAEPCGVAVDSFGDVYVTDNKGFVDRYAPAANPVVNGDYVSQIAVPYPCQIALDSSNGYIYVQESQPKPGGHFGGPLSKYDLSGNPLGALVAGQAHGVAVDQATGKVYSGVRELNQGSVEEFDQSGNLLNTVTTGPPGSETAVAVERATGDIFVGEFIEQPTPLQTSIRVFGPDIVTPTVVTGESTNVSSTGAKLCGTIDPESNTLPASYYFQYGYSPGLGSEQPVSPGIGVGTGTSPVTVCVEVVGLEPSALIYYQLVGVDADGTSVGQLRSVETEPAAPALDSVSEFAVTSTSAIIDANVNPNNEKTTYRFEYGTSTAYGSSVPALEGVAGSGFGDVGVGQQIMGLQPGTTYHFRVVARNAAGTAEGLDQTFTTRPVLPPLVKTEPASAVSQRTAVLSGSVNPQGVTTSYEFDIGTDTTYGSRVFGDAGDAAEPELVTLDLHGLAPGTLYHYRLAATSSYGTVYGADETFVTPGFPTAALMSPGASPLVPIPVFSPPSRAGATTIGAPPAKAKKKKTRKRKQHGRGRSRKATRAGSPHDNNRRSR